MNELHLLLANVMTEGLYFATLSVEAIRIYRERGMMRNTFLKVRVYGDLHNETVEYLFIQPDQKHKTGKQKASATRGCLLLCRECVVSALLFLLIQLIA